MSWNRPYFSIVDLLIAVTVFGGACSLAEDRSIKQIPSNILQPGAHYLSLTVGDLKRDYVIYIPKSYDRKRSAPAVIMFHGGGGQAANAIKETQWHIKADKEGFLLVLPEGTRKFPSRAARFIGNPQNWNDGSNRINIGAVKRKVDDVGFIDRLINELITRFNVDAARIYATGFSNGASMAFRVGRELSNRLAAIAPVAGSDWLQQPTIISPIALLYITGTADRQNPIEGGNIKLGRGAYGKKPPVHSFLKIWVEMLHCSPEARVIHEQNGVKGIVYSRCKENREVILYTIDGMGHTWPGGTSLLPERLVGKTSDKINGTNLIWNFFEKHTIN